MSAETTPVEPPPKHPMADMINHIAFRVKEMGPDYPARIGEFHELSFLLWQCGQSLEKLLK